MLLPPYCETLSVWTFTLQAVLKSCEDCLNQVKQGTDKYQQTLANAKHAFEKIDKNIGKHFMNSGRK